MPSPWDTEKPVLSKDNAGNPEMIYDYQEQIEQINEELKKIEDAMFAIIDAYSDAKARVRLSLAENFKQAQDKTKKTAGIEILELYIISENPALKADYNNYIYYETKKEMLSKIMESMKARISGIQSNMKFSDWRKQ